MQNHAKLMSFFRCGECIFLLLFLCFCADYVCGSATDESDRVEINGEEYFKVRDPESLEFGFYYARVKNATAAGLVQDIKNVRSDIFCSKEYRCQYVDEQRLETQKAVHFSIMHEHLRSAEAAKLFLQQYGLENSFLFISLEDLGNFCCFLDQEGRLNIGLPLEHPLQKFRASVYNFEPFLKKYKAQKREQHIVFLSSGRSGFESAGEFLFQLHKEEGLSPYRKVHFFFTALEEKEFAMAPEGIAERASCIASQEKFDCKNWLAVFYQYVDHVVCQKVYKEQVVFAQDAGNILVRAWSRNVADRLKETPWERDVFVGWPSGEDHPARAPYLAQAYSLFDMLSKAIGVDCITGEEDPECMPDRSQRTLVCLCGPLFPFARPFGLMLQQKFNYKSLAMVEGPCPYVYKHRVLVVGGSLVDEVFSEKLEVLSTEEKVVIEDQVYDKVRHEELIRYGFAYTRKKGAGRDLARDIKKVHSDNLSVSYHGHYVERGTSKISKITHLSLEYERLFCSRFAICAMSKYGILGSFTCVDFEDFPDFEGAGVVCCDGVVHLGRPKKHPALGAPGEKDRFNLCIKQYVSSGALCKDKPIVFCSSGRNGLCGAGEFLAQLRLTEEVWAHKPHVYFLFAALQLGDKESLDARQEIALAAAQADDHGERTEGYWQDVFDASVQAVDCGKVYSGKVVFAQDKENIFMGCASGDVLDRLKDKNGQYDVMVGHVIGLCLWSPTFFCMQHAYRLFEDLSERLKAHCIGGQENRDALPDKEHTTLLCVYQQRSGQAKFAKFAEVTQFYARLVADRLGYKDIAFIEADFGCVRCGSDLIVGGEIKDFPQNISSEVLFSRPK